MHGGAAERDQAVQQATGTGGSSFMYSAIQDGGDCSRQARAVYRLGRPDRLFGQDRLMVR